MSDKLETNLKEFKEISLDWFEKRPFLEEYWAFFQEFFKPEKLRRAAWSDFQEVGDHIHALAGNALARARAFGNQNYSIETYRASFEFLAHGEGTLEDRMREFLKNPQHASKYLGSSSIGEMLGQLHAEENVFVNRRDKKAAEFLGIDPGYRRGDDAAAKFVKFNKAIAPVFQSYEKIVGRCTDLPLGIEVDQFFSWLYENKIAGVTEKDVQQVWMIGAGREGSQKDRFLSESIMAIGMLKLGDLSKYKGPRALEEKMAQVFPGEPRHKNDIRACLDFVHNMKIGDLVFLKQGRRELIAYGFITGAYEFLADESSYRNVRKIEWLDSGSWMLETSAFLATKTLTNITPYPEFVSKLKSLVGLDVDDPQDTTKYWWLNCNPKQWEVASCKIGERMHYTARNERGNKRQVYKYFTAAQPGDKVIAYTASPTRKVTSELMISKGLHVEEDEERVEFEVIGQFEDGPDWEKLKGVPELASCEPLKNNQGSLFSLREQEFKTIHELALEGGAVVEEAAPAEFTIEDAIDGLFFGQSTFERMLERLRTKKNLILLGPPGVGKTYIVKRLAYALFGERDPKRLKMVQFHQSYSYEDFIQGFRPNETGGFELRQGVFYSFCEKAREDNTRPYVFIIDEINRGNLSKILGELMMLIEADKRTPEYAMPLAYQESGHSDFYVPENLYIIGMMNTADRSLAMVDYALRRRFSFINLEPAFTSSEFNAYLDQITSDRLKNHILTRFTTLNQAIRKETANLGPGFEVGHSYFCVNGEGELDESSYHQIVETEIAPLLREYWFDRSEEAEKWIEALRLPELG